MAAPQAAAEEAAAAEGVPPDEAVAEGLGVGEASDERPTSGIHPNIRDGSETTTFEVEVEDDADAEVAALAVPVVATEDAATKAVVESAAESPGPYGPTLSVTTLEPPRATSTMAKRLHLNTSSSRETPAGLGGRVWRGGGYGGGGAAVAPAYPAPGEGAVLDGFAIVGGCAAELPEECFQVTLTGRGFVDVEPDDLFHFAELSMLDVGRAVTGHWARGAMS